MHVENHFSNLVIFGLLPISSGLCAHKQCAHDSPLLGISTNEKIRQALPLLEQVSCAGQAPWEGAGPWPSSGSVFDVAASICGTTVTIGRPAPLRCPPAEFPLPSSAASAAFWSRGCCCPGVCSCANPVLTAAGCCCCKDCKDRESPLYGALNPLSCGGCGAAS